MENMLPEIPQTQKIVLLKLKALVNLFNSSDIWGCFSMPAPCKKLRNNQKKEDEQQFTSDEVNDLKNLKKLLTTHLAKKFNNRCAYCKRSMGNYGYSWQIEHVLDKKNHSDKMFELGNLALSCIDCNCRKNHAIDSKELGVRPKIIDPNDNQSYATHLHFYQISTEDFHFLKYQKVSEVGKSTIEHLKFSLLESKEIISNNHNRRGIFFDLENAKCKFNDGSESGTTLVSFLSELDERLVPHEHNS